MPAHSCNQCHKWTSPWASASSPSSWVWVSHSLIHAAHAALAWSSRIDAWWLHIDAVNARIRQPVGEHCLTCYVGVGGTASMCMLTGLEPPHNVRQTH